MAQMTFTLEDGATIAVRGCQGSLEIQGHDDATVVIECGSRPMTSWQNGVLVIEVVEDDLRLVVPRYAELTLGRVDGDVQVREVAAMEIAEVAGDLDVQAISQRAMIQRVSGDATLRDLADLAIPGRVDGDLRVSNVSGALQLGAVGGDLQLRDICGSAAIRDVEGDADIAEVASLVLSGRVGGAAQISQVHAGRLELAAVDGDLELREIIAACNVGHVGGDAHACGVMTALTLTGGVDGDFHAQGIASGALTVSHVGGDLTLDDVRASCRVHTVDGDARMVGLRDLILDGAVGGDLQLFNITEGRIALRHVGGDADLRDISAPCTVEAVDGDLVACDLADLTLGRVGGDVHLERIRGLLRFDPRNVGGDLSLAADLRFDPRNVGGDLSLADDLRATPAVPAIPPVPPIPPIPPVSPISPARSVASAASSSETRLAVLTSLEHGQISVEEAMALLAHVR